jgi:DNA-binding GntR family transcriptional regulator
MAAQHADKDGIARLRALCAEGEAALASDDIDAMVVANAQLHRLVTELSANQILLDFVTQVDRRVRWYYTPIARQRGKKSWQEHAKLIDAIERGDADTASKIMREHTERTRQSYLEQRKGAEQPVDPAATPIKARRRRVAPKV